MMRGRLRLKLESECMSIQFILNEGAYLMQKNEQGCITNILTTSSACLVVQSVEDQRS